MMAAITQQDIAEGLQELGAGESPGAIAHSSLRSFRYVDGGAEAVVRALLSVCRTVIVPAGSWDLTGVPAPPDLVRPNNACRNARSWEEFDSALQRAVPYSDDLPIDRELGQIPETLRQLSSHRRSPHPLMSYIATGELASELIGVHELRFPLAPLEALSELGGDVLLLGVSHTKNTAIHLAEQQLGRSRFYRYAKAADGVWMELPNIPGDSDGFDQIEPELSPFTREVQIGECRARRIPLRYVIDITRRMITENPAALLPPNLEPDSRGAAAVQQRLAQLRREERSTQSGSPST